MDFWRWYFWIAPAIVAMLAVAVLVRRHLQLSYVTWTVYLCFQVLASAVLISYVLIPGHFGNLQGYRRLLIASTFIHSILEIMVLYGLASDLVVDRSSIRRFLAPLFRWTAALFILASVAICAALPRAGLDFGIGAFQIVNFSTNLLKVGLLLSLLIFTRMLRVHWRTLPAGIALGFGVAAACELAASAFYSVVTPGVPAYVAIDFLRMGGWHACVVIWLIYLLMEGRAPRSQLSGVHQSDLEFWNQELRGLLGKSSPSSEPGADDEAEGTAAMTGDPR